MLLVGGSSAGCLVGSACCSQAVGLGEHRGCCRFVLQALGSEKQAGYRCPKLGADNVERCGPLERVAVGCHPAHPARKIGAFPLQAGLDVEMCCLVLWQELLSDLGQVFFR